MSYHIDTYGTWESHYMTQPNYDEGTGAFEFGQWHTQYREGLVPLVLDSGGVDGFRIPPGETVVEGYSATAIDAVVPLDIGGPRSPSQGNRDKPSGSSKEPEGTRGDPARKKAKDDAGGTGPSPELNFLRGGYEVG